MADKKLLLIDGNSVAFRAFYILYESGGNPEAQYFKNNWARFSPQKWSYINAVKERSQEKVPNQGFFLFRQTTC